MKHADIFASFLKDTVNLNQSRIDTLESNVTALKDFVRGSGWKPKIRGFDEQGSWAHGTIIRPVDGDEFDADLLVVVKPSFMWNASDYVTSLAEVFRASGVYKDKVEVHNYCVRIVYSGDNRVDIAPCVEGRQLVGQLEVCNRPADRFERTEPVKYTKWVKERNEYSGSNSFRKVTRLVKYLRDIKTTFTCPSVLLTTLLAMQIEWWDKDADDFADVPTTLRTIMRRLDDWLQDRPQKPAVANPHLPREDFAAQLTEAQYANFRAFIHKYRGWIDAAYDEQDRAKSIKAWQRIFGDEFADGEEVKDAKAAALNEDNGTYRSGLLATTAPAPDLVERVRQLGLRILPTTFYMQPHMKEPPWIRAHNATGNIQISAVWQPSRSSSQRTAVKDGQFLKPGGGLWFTATVNGTQPIPDGFSVQWRITNTGPVAKTKRQERGGFYPPGKANGRWEPLSFRGVHMAEAFVIRKSDSVLVGQSRPFNVVIE